MKLETSKVGKRGMIVLPAALRKKFGIEEGSYVIAEDRNEGILIRPAAVVPIEMYTPERIAEFFLNNAVSKDDYEEALKEVRKLGLDPDKIDHDKPF